jgi:hypothetical protein
MNVPPPEGHVDGGCSTTLTVDFVVEKEKMEY